MSLRKRGSVWWIDFYSPNGERIRRSTETENKAQAKELHDKLKVETWRLQKLGERPKRYWEDAVLGFLKEADDKATYEEDKSKLRWLDPFLAGKEIETINRELIDRMFFRSLGAGRRRRWCAAMRTSPRITWPPLCREGRTHGGHNSVTATVSLKAGVTVSPRNRWR